MGIFSYTESIMYVYMKYNGHSLHNVCPHMFILMHEIKTDRQTYIDDELLNTPIILYRPSMI